MTTAPGDDHEDYREVGDGSGPSLDETYIIERTGPAGPVIGAGHEADEGVAAELYVERVGPPGAPTVYYIHGGPGYNAYSFRELVGDDLGDYDVIYADQRGGGRSHGATSLSTTTLAQDVHAVLAALDVDRATLLAHGFGAAIAVRAAVLRPELVERLVLVNPWLSMPLLAQALNDEARSLAGGTATQAGYDEEDAGPTVDDGPSSDPQALVDEAFATVNPKVLFDSMEFPTAAGRLRLEHVDAVALAGDLTDEVPPGVWSLDELDTVGQLEAAGVPVVVLSGSKDRTSYPVQAEQALLRCPSALFSLLDAGHYPWIDDPEPFIEVLLQALPAPRT